MLLVLFLAMLLTLGVAMVAQGWRGRRVGDEPHCKRCGFNLVGMPADSARCSECGTDVTGPNAVVRGERHRRPGLIVAGAAAVLIPLAIIGTGVGAMLGSNRLNELKPLWWLKLDAGRSSASARLAAFREMQNRVSNGALDGPALAALVESILARQADASATWDTGWGDLLESIGKRTNTLSEQQWTTYAQNAVKNAIALRVRPRVRRGDPVPCELRVGGPSWRGGGGSFGGLWIDLTYAAELGDFRIGRDNGSRFGFSGSTSGSSGNTIEAEDVARAHLRDGPNTLRCVVHALVSYDQGGRAVTEFDIPLTATFAQLPAGEPSVIEAQEPNQLLAIRDALRPQGVQVHKRDEHWTSLEIQFDVKNIPVPVAFDVFLRERDAGKRETKFSSFAFPAGATTRYGLGTSLKPDLADALLNAGAVDLVLKPSGTAAARSMTLTEYWSAGDEPIVIENVPVTTQK